MTDRACPGDEVLVALALGQLTGIDRAETLDHLAGCPGCRAQVDDLTETADQVLLAAPVDEPPAGFESAVLDRLAAEPRPVPASRAWRGRRTAVALVAAAALVVGVVVGAVALDRARGEPVDVAVSEAAMVTPGGREVGAAWVHEGDSPWIVVSVPGWRAWDDVAGRSLDYRLRVELDSGDHVDAGEIVFGPDGGAWRTGTDLDTSEIRSLAVVDEDGRVWCEGVL
jgi:hypothetical protein